MAFTLYTNKAKLNLSYGYITVSESVLKIIYLTKRPITKYTDSATK